jgi:hypothetical protein
VSAPSDDLAVEARRWLADAEAFRVAEANGYETVVISAGFEEVSIRTVDRFVDGPRPTELELVALGLTAFKPLIELVAPGWAAEQHRERVRDVFRLLDATAAGPEERPRFVLAHVPSPHAPFVFGASGEPTGSIGYSWLYLEHAPREVGGPDDYDRAYVEQARYIGDLTLASIDRILTRIDRPAAIVVFSDHGSASTWRAADPAGPGIDERSANLIAVLTPGHDRLLPDDISLVNVLGPLFNAYLLTDYATQPDQVFAWRDGRQSELVAVQP